MEVQFWSPDGADAAASWFDAVALRRSIVHSSVSGLGVTKLDVLDGLDTIRVCVGYRVGGEILSRHHCLQVRTHAEVEPVYEEIPGWEQCTVGVQEYAELPTNAKRYLERIEALVGVPLDLISTGAERDQTIIVRHPFDS